MNRQLSPSEVRDNEFLCRKLLHIFHEGHLEKTVNQIVMELRHLLAMYDENGVYDGDHLYKIYLQATLGHDQIEDGRSKEQNAGGIGK